MNTSGFNYTSGSGSSSYDVTYDINTVFVTATIDSLVTNLSCPQCGSTWTFSSEDKLAGHTFVRAHIARCVQASLDSEYLRWMKAVYHYLELWFEIDIVTGEII